MSDLLADCFSFFFHRDLAQAAVHGEIRYSRLTIRLAQALKGDLASPVALAVSMVLKSGT